MLGEGNCKGRRSGGCSRALVRLRLKKYDGPSPLHPSEVISFSRLASSRSLPALLLKGLCKRGRGACQARVLVEANKFDEGNNMPRRL